MTLPTDLTFRIRRHVMDLKRADGNPRQVSFVSIAKTCKWQKARSWVMRSRLQCRPIVTNWASCRVQGQPSDRFDQEVHSGVYQMAGCPETSNCLSMPSRVHAYSIIERDYVNCSDKKRPVDFVPKGNALKVE